MEIFSHVETFLDYSIISETEDKKILLAWMILHAQTVFFFTI